MNTREQLIFPKDAYPIEKSPPSGNSKNRVAGPESITPAELMLDPDED